MIRLEKTVLQILGLENILVHGVFRWFLPSGVKRLLLENTMLFPKLACLGKRPRVVKVRKSKLPNAKLVHLFKISSLIFVKKKLVVFF